MALVMMLIDDHNYNLMMMCQRCLTPAPKATVANSSAPCAGQGGDAKSKKKKNNILVDHQYQYSNIINHIDIISSTFSCSDHSWLRKTGVSDGRPLDSPPRGGCQPG